jgi:hypothetical protein
MADFSNNPFIDHTASVASRFPNINAVSSPSSPASSALQYSTSWPQQQQQQQQQPSYHSGYLGSNPTGYPQQSFQQQQPQWQQQQQQQQSPYQAQPQSPYSPSPTSYQSPTQPSPLGHQFAGQVNSLATGYPQGQIQAQAQYTGYPTQQAYGYQQQQPQQAAYGYPPHQQQQRQLLAQFDPYANLGQLSPPSSGTSSIQGAFGNGAMASSTQAQQQQQQQQQPPGVQHPRAFIQSHKAELEAWDPPTWKQVQGSFDALKTAWETRKRAAETQVRALGGTVGAAPASTGFFGGGGGRGYDGYGGYGNYGGAYQQQTPQAQEIDRLNAVRIVISRTIFLFCFRPAFFDMRVCFAVFFFFWQLIREAESNIGTLFFHFAVHKHVILNI